MRKSYAMLMSFVLSLCTAIPQLPTGTAANGWSYCQFYSLRDSTELSKDGIKSSQESQGLRVWPIRILDRNNLWAVGHFKTQDPFSDGSVILYSSNGGRSWKDQLINTKQHFDDVSFVNQQVGWVCGDEGLILKSTDGGRSWSKQDTPTESHLIEIQFINSEIGWAVGIDGEVIRTTDGGLHWISHSIEASGDIYFLSFRDSLNGWLVGEKNQAYESTDGGISWKPRAAELVNLLDKTGKHEAHFGDVKFVSPNVGFIAASIRPKIGIEEGADLFTKNVVFKTEDGGRRWAVLFEKRARVLYSAEFISEKEMWIIFQNLRNNKEVLRTEDGGKTWIKVSTLPYPAPASVYFANSKNGWTSTGDGMYADYIYYTNDGGKSWFKSELPQISKNGKILSH